MSKTVKNNWVTSKEVLLKTAISRATLNNYIRMGIVPRPVVQKPPGDFKKTKQIGYFPEAVIERINLVKRLKREGNSMEKITKDLKEMSNFDQPFPHTRRDNIYPLQEDSKVRNVLERPGAAERKGLKLTIDDINFSSFLINRNFEIEWINNQAEKEIFNKEITSIVELESRNIFKIFFSWEFHDHLHNWRELIAFHMAFAKSRLKRSDIPKLYQGISEREIRHLEEVYDDLPPFLEKGINKTYVNLDKRDGSKTAYDIYSVFFREGVFFVYAEKEKGAPEIPEFLSSREKVINDLLKQRMPSLVSLCVLVADLQDSVKISAELPPAEYFELINALWKTIAGSFDKYQGIHGKHAGDGMLCYFIKKPGSNYIMEGIKCALEMSEKTRRLSNEWKARKGWTNDLYLNIGLNEGKEFFGTVQSASNIEFTALGDSINYTGRLSDLARFGSILATKNMINKLTPEEVKQIRFGVRRRSEGREIFVRNSFSRVLDLLEPSDPRYNKFLEIITLPVTEIVELIDPYSPPEIQTG
ncbi:MAG: hypothetical protein KJ573_03045 [Proteobacteria bacterium]|nr:hypothetical protein [Pseudomonadota bacterium]